MAKNRSMAAKQAKAIRYAIADMKTRQLISAVDEENERRTRDPFFMPVNKDDDNELIYAVLNEQLESAFNKFLKTL